MTEAPSKRARIWPRRLLVAFLVCLRLSGLAVFALRAPAGPRVVGGGVSRVGLEGGAGDQGRFVLDCLIPGATLKAESEHAQGDAVRSGKFRSGHHGNLLFVWDAVGLVLSHVRVRSAFLRESLS